MDTLNIKTRQDAVNFINYLCSLYWTKDVEYYCYEIFKDVIADADEHHSKIDRLKAYINTLVDSDINDEFVVRLLSIADNCNQVVLTREVEPIWSEVMDNGN